MATPNSKIPKELLGRAQNPFSVKMGRDKRGTILKTYGVPIYPLPDKGEWNIPEHIATEVVLPPKFKRPPGRPKKQLEKSFSELSKRKGTNSCSTCGQQGHNRRSCRTATRNA